MPGQGKHSSGPWRLVLEAENVFVEEVTFKLSFEGICQIAKQEKSVWGRSNNMSESQRQRRRWIWCMVSSSAGQELLTSVQILFKFLKPKNSSVSHQCLLPAGGCNLGSHTALSVCSLSSSLWLGSSPQSLSFMTFTLLKSTGQLFCRRASI